MSAFEEKAVDIQEVTAKIAEVAVSPQEMDQAQIEKELAKQKKREEIAAKVAAMKAAMAAQAEAATAAPVAAPASESKEAPREAGAESGPAAPTSTATTTKADKSAIKKKNLEKAKLYEAMFLDAPKQDDVEWKPTAESQYGADIQQSFRVGHTKGKTGASDFTKGKCAFVRPCTVGWRSQNQPVSKGGGNRTPL